MIVVDTASQCFIILEIQQRPPVWHLSLRPCQHTYGVAHALKRWWVASLRLFCVPRIASYFGSLFVTPWHSVSTLDSRHRDAFCTVTVCESEYSWHRACSSAGTCVLGERAWLWKRYGTWMLKAPRSSIRNLLGFWLGSIKRTLPMSDCCSAPCPASTEIAAIALPVFTCWAF